MSSIRILVADDYKDWCNQVCLLLRARPEWQIVGEASDGLEAVQMAEELKPDLIVLDSGLPNLNGIEAARRIRKLSPDSRIIFLSLDNSLEVVQVALSTGARAYVYKARAKSDLLPAIDAVLAGKQFVTSMFKGYRTLDAPATKAPPRHEVQFYSDEAFFLDGFARIIATALEAGDVAVVAASFPHLDCLAQRLKARGLDIDAATRQGTYIPLDVARVLSAFMVNGMPDEDRFFEATGDLIKAAAKGGKGEHPRVVALGECSPLLWAEGKVDAAIRVEQLWDQIGETYEIDIYCAYALSSFRSERDQKVFQSICAEHSAVYSQRN